MREKLADLGTQMLAFSAGIDDLDTPEKVLDALHEVSQHACGINVLVAAMMPLQWGSWAGVERGKTVFLHGSAPAGWWEEWLELSRVHPGPGLMMARISLAPFTTSESMRMLQPLGTDRWPIELALKHGMRDGLTCPVGGRWVIAYWSKAVLSGRLLDEARAILFMGATFAAIRLQQLVESQVSRIGERAPLTPRELSVLRLLADGNQVAEVARHLELGEETVRSHIKKAQAKLGVRNRTHAVAQAIRRQVIV